MGSLVAIRPQVRQFTDSGLADLKDGAEGNQLVVA